MTKRQRYRFLATIMVAFAALVAVLRLVERDNFSLVVWRDVVGGTVAIFALVCIITPRGQFWAPPSSDVSTRGG